MIYTIQSNWSEHGFLSFEQRILVIAIVFILVLFVSYSIKKRPAQKEDPEDQEDLEEVVGFTPFDQKDVLGLNRREVFGENRLHVEREETERERKEKANTHYLILSVVIMLVSMVILRYLLSAF